MAGITPALLLTAWELSHVLQFLHRSNMMKQIFSLFANGVIPGECELGNGRRLHLERTLENGVALLKSHFDGRKITKSIPQHLEVNDIAEALETDETTAKYIINCFTQHGNLPYVVCRMGNRIVIMNEKCTVRGV